MGVIDLQVVTQTGFEVLSGTEVAAFKKATSQDTQPQLHLVEPGAMFRGKVVWADGTMEFAEEVATVGLSDDDGMLPHDPLAITENMIRAEHNEHKRLKYGLFNRHLVI